MKKTQSISSKPKRHLSYGDLSLDDLRKAFRLTVTRPMLFERINQVEPSGWLSEVLKAGFAMSVVSEKARSEFLVAPILLDIQQRHQGQLSIYSGVKFDVEPERGLRGICDFIMSASPMLPTVQSPVCVMVEAKKNDIEEGLGAVRRRNDCGAYLQSARAARDSFDLRLRDDWGKLAVFAPARHAAGN